MKKNLLFVLYIEIVYSSLTYLRTPNYTLRKLLSSTTLKTDNKIINVTRYYKVDGIVLLGV